MALITEVIKIPVTKLASNLFKVGMNMILTDNSVEVINKNYYIRHRIGDSVNTKIAQISSHMQEDINKYKTEQTIYGSAQLDTAVVTVQTALEV